MTPAILKTFGPKNYIKNGTEFQIKATVRYDDQCKNGYDSFSITGEQYRIVRGMRREDSFGCIHELVAEHFPELRPFIKWHSMTEHGPLHYLANTIYLAGDRDCWGLRKDETKQLTKGKTGMPCWELGGRDVNGTLIPICKLPRMEEGEQAPTSTFTLEWVPVLRVGEGKARQLDSARSVAVWPDATDEDLTAPGLKERLEQRLPGLMAAFEKDLERIRALDAGTRWK